MMDALRTSGKSVYIYDNRRGYIPEGCRFNARIYFERGNERWGLIKTDIPVTSRVYCVLAFQQRLCFP
jgi:hypothetical protein